MAGSGLRDFPHDEWLSFDQPGPGLVQQLQRHRPVGPALLALVLIALAVVAVAQNRGSKNQNATAAASVSIAPLLGPDPALAYDAKRRQVVLLNQAGQTWLWANQTWSLAHPAASPPMGVDGMGFDAAAWDPGIGQVLLVGVVGNESASAHTYAWNGTTWTPLQLGAEPPAGALSMAYDPTDREMVLLVGLASPSGTIEVETLVFEGGRWLRHPSLESDALSASSAIGFDASSYMLLALSSNGAGSATQTWRWDGDAWHPLTPLHSPPGSAHMTLVNEPGSGKLLLLTQAYALFGQPTVTETWTWDGHDWTERLPLGESNEIPYAVTAGGELWAFQEVPPDAYAPRSLEAFKWSGASWDHVAVAPVSPARRATHSRRRS